jgi:hypothetical protein
MNGIKLAAAERQKFVKRSRAQSIDAAQARRARQRLWLAMAQRSAWFRTGLIAM